MDKSIILIKHSFRNFDEMRMFIYHHAKCGRYLGCSAMLGFDYRQATYSIKTFNEEFGVPEYQLYQILVSADNLTTEEDKAQQNLFVWNPSSTTREQAWFIGQQISLHGYQNMFFGGVDSNGLVQYSILINPVSFADGTLMENENLILNQLYVSLQEQYPRVNWNGVGIAREQ